MAILYMLILVVGNFAVSFGADVNYQDNSRTDVMTLLTQLNDQMANMKNQIDELKDEDTKHLELIAELKKQNVEQTKLFTKQKVENEVLNAALSHGNNEDDVTGIVAFHVKIGGFTGSPTDPSQILFDIIDLNLGNAYDPTTGTFMPPVDGIYSLSWEFVASNSCGTTYTCVGLYIDQVRKTQSCGVYPNSSGSAVTLQLTAGESVGLWTNPAATCQSLNAASDQHRFSGHLIYQLI